MSIYSLKELNFVSKTIFVYSLPPLYHFTFICNSTQNQLNIYYMKISSLDNMNWLMICLDCEIYKMTCIHYTIINTYFRSIENVMSLPFKVFYVRMWQLKAIMCIVLG